MSNNKIILSGCIDQFKSFNELVTNDSETFELFCLTQITKSQDLAFEDIQNSIVDGGNDGGIDSLLIIIDDFIPESIDDLEEIKFSKKTNVSLIFSQCKKENSFKEVAIDKLITTLPELFDLGKSERTLLTRFNADLVEKALIARKAWINCSIGGGNLKIYYNYAAYAENVEINGTFKDKIRQLRELSSKTFIGANIKYENFSSEELLKLYQLQKNRRLQITYKETPLSTNYLTHGIGYVGTVKLGDYKKFLTDEDSSIREDLFENNIRHYQGSVDVNKKVKESIEQVSNEDFWWLNNGITIIANNPSLVGTTLAIDNVQIVNGLQTSYSIFLNHDGNLDDTRSVLLKVIINDDKKTVDHIIASTNSQNPVSAALLRATDDVQREIELYFLNEGYFYDRRKNYYKNQGKPASKIFSIQSTAQSIETILFNSPNSARSKPTSLIKDDITYNRIFNSAYNYKIYLITSLICKITVDHWGNISDKDLKNRLSNFKLHLARVATSVILKKFTFTADNLLDIKLDQLTDDIFLESANILNTSITKYQADNPEANLINMAKAKGLTETVLLDLQEIYS